MGLKDSKENEIKRDAAKIVWENENRTLSKIANMAESKIANMDEKEKRPKTSTFETTKSAIGAQEECEIRNYYKTVKLVDLRNKEGEIVSVFSSDKKDVMVLSKSIDDETSVGITKDNDGSIIYTLISPETGKVDLARVSHSNIEVYNYGTKRIKSDRSIYSLQREYPFITDIAGDKVEGNTLREIVSSHIQEHGLMGQYSERIMSAFDSILSLDEERDITPLSKEQISQIELLRESEAMKDKIEKSKESYQQMQDQLLIAEKRIDELTQQLSKSEKRIDELTQQLSKSKEQLESSKTTNKRLSEIISRIKERVSKIPFFGKKALRDIGVTEQQLPVTPNESSNDFEERYAVDASSLNRESDIVHDSKNIKSGEDKEIDIDE